MPELPEVEVLRRSLLPHLVGDRIERVEVRNPALRETVDTARLRRAAKGREIKGLRRRSKYLLIDLEGGWTMVVHLGMSGRLTLAPGDAPAEPHEHVAFHLRSGRRLRLRDPGASGWSSPCPRRSSRPILTSPIWALSPWSRASPARRWPARPRGGGGRSKFS